MRRNAGRARTLTLSLPGSPHRYHFNPVTLRFTR